MLQYEAKESEKIEAKRKEANNLFISFAKRSEKEAKRFLFRFEAKQIISENGTPYSPVSHLPSLASPFSSPTPSPLYPSPL